MKTVSIIGKQGSLAQSIRKKLIDRYQTTCYSKSEFDLRNKQVISKLAEKIYKNDIIIFCSGVDKDHDSWDMMLINTVSFTFLLEKLIELGSKSHVIAIGSTGSRWVSWPGITYERLCYNISKQTLLSVATGLDHSKISKIKLSILNASRFENEHNEHSGYQINDVVDNVINIIEFKIPILVYEHRGFNNDN